MSVETEFNQNPRYGEYAGFVTRLVAFVVDIAVLVVVATLIGMAISLLTQFFNSNEMAENLLLVIAAMITMSINVGYFVVFWMLVGMTPGMRIMGLLVVSVDGGRVTFGMAVRRYIGYFISAIFLIGFLWVLIDARRQGFHDKLGGTLVIYDWPDKELSSQRKAPILDAGIDVRQRRQQRAASK